MSSPSDLRFTDSHEWLKVDGETITLGITQFAADELTDITYVEMKPAGTKIGPAESVGEVESVKTTSDIYCPVGGEIIEVNEAAAGDPSLLNSDPFGEGWLIRIRAEDTSPLEGLMDQDEYDGKYPTGQ